MTSSRRRYVNADLVPDVPNIGECFFLVFFSWCGCFYGKHGQVSDKCRLYSVEPRLSGFLMSILYCIFQSRKKKGSMHCVFS